MRKKLALAVASALAIVAVPVAVWAGFSPANRATFQCITPTNCPGANYVTFNSFTNAPNYGDERAFLDAKDAANTASGGYQDKMTVQDGQKVVMRIYVHNNANPAAIGESAATAKNTKVQVLLPTSVKTANQASASISADNANPGTVSDTVDFVGANPFSLAFDRNSMVQVTYRPNGTGDYVTRSLPGAVFANDQTLNAAIGDWKGCFNYSALITVTVVVKMEHPKPPVVKFACTGLDAVQVSRSRYDFTASATAENATIQSYVFTAKNSSGNVVDTKTVTTSATSAKYAFDQSTPGTYTVNAVVNTDKGSTHPGDCVKSVKVEKETPQVKFACTGLDAVQKGRTQFDFTAHAMVQNATVKSYDFTAKNASGNVVDTQKVTTNATSANYVFDQSNPGDYTVYVVVNTDKGSTNPHDCQKTVTVKEKPVTPVFACKSLTVTPGANRSITATVDYLADGGAKLTSITYDFGDGSTPLLSGNTTVHYTYAKDGNYVVSATLAFNVNDVIKTVRCTASVSITTPPVTPPVTPPTPPAPLPNTGPGAVAGLFTGVSALGAAVHYASRRFRG